MILWQLLIKGPKTECETLGDRDFAQAVAFKGI